MTLPSHPRPKQYDSVSLHRSPNFQYCKPACISAVATLVRAWGKADCDAGGSDYGHLRDLHRETQARQYEVSGATIRRIFCSVLLLLSVCGIEEQNTIREPHRIPES